MNFHHTLPSAVLPSAVDESDNEIIDMFPVKKKRQINTRNLKVKQMRDIVVCHR